MTVADYQESLNIIEPYREVWVCVPELVNKTITIDVLWPIILLGLQISDSWYPLDTAHSKCPWNWGKKNMKPGHKKCPFRLWVRTHHKQRNIATRQVSTIKLSTPKPSHRAACWEIDPQHGNALQSVSVDPNVQPPKKLGIAGKHSPPTGGIGGIDLPNKKWNTTCWGGVYMHIYIYILEWLRNIRKSLGMMLSSQLLQEPINSHKVLKPCYF